MLSVFEVMKDKAFHIEVIVVTEAVGHTFDGLDFVADAFHRAGGDRLVEIGEDTVTVGFDGIGEFRQFGDVGRPCGRDLGTALER